MTSFWRRLNSLTPVLVLVVSGVATADSRAHRTDLSADEWSRIEKLIQPAVNFQKAEKYESMQGGAATERGRQNRDAFSQPQSNLSFSDREKFSLGNALFRKLWVSSPSSTLASDGLGPLFNARACQACHIKDGRGHLPNTDEKASSLVFALSQQNANGRSSPDPRYGHQLQTFAVPGLLAEGTIDISYSQQQLKFIDGEIANLRQPVLTLRNSNYGPVSDETFVSARIAPPMIGVGLLEAIAESDLRALADPDDINKDGVSGRLSIVEFEGRETVGRFGYRARQPTVRSQSAAAFANDLGLSNPLHTAHTGDCTPVQHDCLNKPHGEQLKLGKHEVPDNLLDLVSFYSANLAPPRRRSVNDSQVLRGKKQFYSAGCASCHTPKYVTSKKADGLQHQYQLIWPYTDLLLHDMGSDLADRSLDGKISPNREWRTAPLWGIGLTQTVNPRATFLHDGRARTLLEAVLWHGGEAKSSRDAVLAMTQKQRMDLIRFLESL